VEAAEFAGRGRQQWPEPEQASGYSGRHIACIAVDGALDLGSGPADLEEAARGAWQPHSTGHRGLHHRQEFTDEGLLAGSPGNVPVLISAKLETVAIRIH